MTTIFVCHIEGSAADSTEISHVQFVHLSYIWDFSFDDSVEMTLIFGISPRKRGKRGQALRSRGHFGVVQQSRQAGSNDNCILTILSNKEADNE